MTACGCSIFGVFNAASNEVSSFGIAGWVCVNFKPILRSFLDSFGKLNRFCDFTLRFRNYHVNGSASVDMSAIDETSCARCASVMFHLSP